MFVLSYKTMFLSTKDYAPLLTKLRVSFINGFRNQRLLKIGPYRHPKFGGIRKKPYLCNVIQKKGC